MERPSAPRRLYAVRTDGSHRDGGIDVASAAVSDDTCTRTVHENGTHIGSESEAGDKHRCNKGPEEDLARGARRQSEVLVDVLALRGCQL